MPGRYQALSFDESFSNDVKQISQQSSNAPRALTIANAILFCFSVIFLRLALVDFHSTSKESEVPMFSGAINPPDNLQLYRPITFINDPQSIYRGPPRDEVSNAWKGLTNVDPFGIDEHIRQKLGAPPNSAKFPDHLGGQYKANLAVFHQLHCLRSLWQYTYFDYYKPRYRMFQTSEDELHEHLDHCADLLRQALMCHGDTTIIPFFDSKNETDLPIPQYGLDRKCRDFEAIREWGLEREVHEV